MIPLGVMASAQVDSGSGAVGVTPLGLHSSTADLSTYTWTVPLGDPSPGRTIIVCASARYDYHTIDSITLDGTPMTIDVATPSSPGSAAVARLARPAGTTATVALNLSSGQRRAAIGVYAVDTPLTLADSDQKTTSWDDTGTGTLSAALTGDVMFAAIDKRKNHDEHAETITGITVDWWVDLEGEAYPHFGHAAPAGQMSAHWSTSTTSAGSTQAGLAVASYAIGV